MTNYLCVCQYGHSRSVALARELHGRGYPAVAVGWMTCAGAMTPLAIWADVICLLEARYLDYIPTDQRHKVVVLDVGSNRWSNPYSQELAEILRKLVQEKLCLGLALS